MGTLWHDLRFAVRAIIRRPGLTTVAVLTLSLGIGANTTVFSWVRSILLDPLPWAGNPDRLVEVTANTRGQSFSTLSYPNFLDVRERTRPPTGLNAHPLKAGRHAPPGSGEAAAAGGGKPSAARRGAGKSGGAVVHPPVQPKLPRRPRARADHLGDARARVRGGQPRTAGLG